VSETLRRAVSGDRVGHAYLFCGPRGVGKTTLARVLAMALNCAERSPDGEPCGECESCTRIWSGSTALDVVEIDAASNRGVDDARDLRSRAMYAPSEEGRFKVYIVDEAHMLTREAWNALLKVLEEPPPRVIFIFATTEPEKIEQTAAPILSRCQRFDFRRIAVPEIMSRLRKVMEYEETAAPDAALRLIARKADGGMRDALSLMDQVLALSADDEMTVETVRRILGVVEDERFLETMDLLRARDRAGIFSLVETLLDQGYDLVEYYHGFVEALRTLLRLRVGGEVPELPPESRDDWHARSVAFEAGDLVRMLAMAADLETSGSLRRSSQPRVLLELLLLRFSYLDRTVEIETLLRALGSETPGEPAGSGGAAPLPRRPPPDRSAAEGAQRTAPEGSVEASPVSHVAAPTAAPSSPERSSPERSSPEPSGSERSSPEPSGSESSGSRTGSAAPAPEILRAWTTMLETGDGVPAGLTPYLRGGEARCPSDGELALALPEGPAVDRLVDGGELALLEEALSERVDGTVRIELGTLAPELPEPSSRISSNEVRAGRLGDLLEKEPGLKAAVTEWELDIMDG
jgi:DNA polymerase III subunit gamma/tau